MERSSLWSLCALASMIVLGGCDSPGPNKQYTWVELGGHEWLAHNLAVSSFRNGDPILNAVTDEEWRAAAEAQEPAWSYYENDPEHGPRFGKLYNWYAVNDPRGLGPQGCWIPSDQDWLALTAFLGGDDLAGRKMKSGELWSDHEGMNGNGSNESGFNGVPGGGRYQHGGFNFIGEYGGWWTSTEEDDASARIRRLTHYQDGIDSYALPKGYGMAVRCIR